MKLTGENFTGEQKQYVQYVSEEVARLNDMIAKILDMNAIEQHRINLKMEKVNVYQLLQETIHRVQPSIQIKQIIITLTPAPIEMYATLDWGYATQVLENLLSNAIKFSPVGKHIYLDLQEEADQIRISIRDEGPGFTTEDMSKLFGKFQRLSARPTAGETTTGLGLSIVKKYVEAMQGSISCESTKGNGANFILTFRKYNFSKTELA
jgi:signal transduction histidine kinase